jgi:hypothetical protein
MNTSQLSRCGVFPCNESSREQAERFNLHAYGAGPACCLCTRRRRMTDRRGVARSLNDVYPQDTNHIAMRWLTLGRLVATHHAQREESSDVGDDTAGPLAFARRWLAKAARNQPFMFNQRVTALVECGQALTPRRQARCKQRKKRSYLWCKHSTNGLILPSATTSTLK